jgi:phosphatidylserine/phosphatidylglycerophosphate/cardiolipin synthase-like enzyme
MDRLVAAAAQYPGTSEIRMLKHLGLNHQKTVWFHAQHVVAFGTSNWSDASDDNQLEANIITDKLPGDPLNDSLFADLYAIFERKWFNLAPDGSIETEAWRTPTPRPGDTTSALTIPLREPAALQYPPPPPSAAAATRREDDRDLGANGAIHGTTGRCWPMRPPRAARHCSIPVPQGESRPALAAPQSCVEWLPR